MNAKEEQAKSVYKELITVEVAAEKIAGTDDTTTFLGNIQSRLEEKEEFEDAEYELKNGNTLVIKTKEGYEFAVVGDKVILADDGNGGNGGSGSSGGNTTIPEIKDGVIKFKTVPSYWVNTGVTLEITSPKHPTWTVKYSDNYEATEWETYNGKVTIDSNKAIYAKLENEAGISKDFSTHNITNIDKSAPRLSSQSFKAVEGSITTRGFKVELEVQDKESGLAQITWNYKLKSETKWTKNVTDLYHNLHTKDKGNTELVRKEHTFDRLPSGTYLVQANIYDVAGNVTPTDPIEVKIGTIDDITSGSGEGGSGSGSGTSKYSPTGWTNESVTVTLPTIDGFETRYTTDGSIPNVSSSKYEEGKPIIITKNSRIYYIYTDGVNISKYATAEITNIDKDRVAIRTALKESNIKTDGFTLSLQVEDEPTALAGRSGLSKIDWYYKQSTSTGAYSKMTEIFKTQYGEQSGERGKVTKSKTLTGLTQGTYLVYVDVHDVAGNVTSTKDTPLTIELGSIASEAGPINGSYEPTTWTSGDVRVTLSKAEGFRTMYTDDGSTPTLSNPNLREYIDPFNVSANTRVYFLYTDGTNVTDYGTKNITNIDKTPASVNNFTKTNVTTNSFTLSANIQDGESGIGKIVFYYKHQDDSSYSSRVWSNPDRLALREAPAIQNGPRDLITAEETFTGMKSGTYECYVQVFNTTGTETSTASSPISFALGALPTIGTSSFSPTGWTNTDVTVTLPTANGFSTRYTTNGSNPSVTSTEYSAPIKVGSNGIVKYIYTDGTNINSAGSRNITNIDKKIPTITTGLASKDVTTKGFTLTMSVQDTDTTAANASGISKIIWYYRLGTSGNYTPFETKYKDMNGTANGSRDVVNGSHTFTSLTSGKYQAYAEVYDVAGNKTTSSTIEITLGSLPTLSDLSSSSFSPSTWTNGNVKVTLPTANNYTTRYTTDGSNPTATSGNIYSAPFDVTGNCTIKYVATDGTNITSAKSKAVTNIDKTVPKVTSELAEHSKTTTSITVKLTAQDVNSGLGKIVWYINKGGTWTSEEDVYTTLKGATAGTTTAVEKTHTFSGLTQCTNYQFYAIIFDVAGNQVSSKSSATPLSISSATQAVTGLTVSPSAAQVKNVGQTFTITPTISPSNANNKNVNWTSSNTNVATVSKTSTASGTAITVTCKAAGTATITATAADSSGKKATCNVTVNQPVTGIAISKTSSTLYLGGTTTTTINATISPSNANNQTVNWTTSNSNVVAISNGTSTSGANITLTAKGKGTATITAKAAGNTGLTKTCTVTVGQKVTGVTVSPTSTTINIGATTTITATATPTNADNRGVSWTSSNTNVATVNSSGVVTGKAVGTSTITATASDGSGKSASCTVTVKGGWIAGGNNSVYTATKSSTYLYLYEPSFGAEHFCWWDYIQNIPKGTSISVTWYATRSSLTQAEFTIIDCQGGSQWYSFRTSSGTNTWKTTKDSDRIRLQLGAWGTNNSGSVGVYITDVKIGGVDVF